MSLVDAIIGDFIDAGASYITFHPEATNHIDRSLQLIKNGGCKAGLVFNPATSLDYAKYVLDKLDIILLMSVNPGFGGQAFIPAVLDKAKEARKMIDEAGIDCRLEIDGGVKVDNIKEICEAGVDMFVAGSAILKEPRTVEAYKKTIVSIYPGRLVLSFSVRLSKISCPKQNTPPLNSIISHAVLFFDSKSAGCHARRTCVCQGQWQGTCGSLNVRGNLVLLFHKSQCLVRHTFILYYYLPN